MHVRISSPEGFEPDVQMVDEAARIADATNGSAILEPDPTRAVAGADVVVTDTWISMGKEDEAEQRARTFGAWGVTPTLFSLADPDAIFLHCLPAYRGKEVAAEVIDGPRSVVWDEAENRRHAQKAILTFLLEEVT
jgi:ornithine carbamoyltransferase